jgi:hypothetical protein
MPSGIGNPNPKSAVGQGAAPKRPRKHHRAKPQLTKTNQINDGNNDDNKDADWHCLE